MQRHSLGVFVYVSKIWGQAQLRNPCSSEVLCDIAFRHYHSQSNDSAEHKLNIRVYFARDVKKKDAVVYDYEFMCVERHTRVIMRA